ncbi:Efflux pump periplasmic linker BepF [Chryseobacterium nakagawai]|uniref:Efflux RND transporter periplasmic adaptor subunit n=1 Tax=Chryseobacterium nakagawai TaxID=1241982 RepID=A0AAD0YQX7_CHRNA|nr:efflux RND transporter periplasmic adaptor subunit [Chryseobacterium nakagawai]AZA93525.1 efflux RND transporter periplasmic adaptor subunit [Chryseobacterium nakagawai]VEH20215.1 Efflux pump periplasmic linker BepF [Chryseobacterium nakagawai]
MKKSCYILFILVILLSCSKKKPQKTPEIQSYQVLTLVPGEVTVYNDFPTSIQGQNVVEIKPMVSGYLQDIYVPEGASVTKGQLLFRIKNPQYEQDIITAKAAIKIAEANVNAARMNVEKAKPLVQQEIVSKYELSSAQYTLQSQEAALSQAKATLANAQTNQGYTYIRSPQSGTIGLIPYKIGALVSSTTADPLTTLSNTSNIFAYFSLSEKQLLSFMNSMKGNTTAEKLNNMPLITLVLADGTIYPEKGKMETASGGIDSSTGTATFKVIFNNKLGIIQNGASATIRIPVNLDNALLIPQTAVYQMQDKSFVYKVMSGNRVMSEAVTTSPTDDGNFVVINSGVKAGDKLALNGLNISDSTVIKPTPANAAEIYRTMKLKSN